MAGDVITFDVQGAKEFNAMLSRLETKVAKKVAKEVCKVSLKPILTAAKANISGLGGGTMSNLMRKNLKIYLIAARNLRRGHIGAQVRFKNDVPGLISFSKGSFSNLETKRTHGKRYFIPNAIEYGHAAPGKGGSGQKDVAARPFIRPAFDSKKQEAIKTAENEMKKRVDAMENK